MAYFKPYVQQFDKKIRVYLDIRDDTFSFITSNLIEAINPDIIEQDSDGNFYVILDLIYQNVHKQEDTLTVRFEIIDSPGNEIIMAQDVLENYDVFNDCMILNAGTVKIYHSS